MDKKLEKKQVLVFLKILKISKRLPPAEIAEKLIATGWDIGDAHNAATVLYPNYVPSQTTSSVTTQDTEVPNVIKTATTEIPPPVQSASSSEVSDISQDKQSLVGESEDVSIPPPVDVSKPSPPIPEPTPTEPEVLDSPASVETNSMTEEDEVPEIDQETIDGYVLGTDQDIPQTEKYQTSLKEPPQQEGDVDTIENEDREDEVLFDSPEQQILEDKISTEEESYEVSEDYNPEKVDASEPQSVLEDETSQHIPVEQPVISQQEQPVSHTTDDDRWLSGAGIKNDQVTVPPVVRSMSDTTVAVPHQDAPWLKDQTDIYDITEEEKELLIKTVLNSHEKLNPKTVHALLGIDVSLSEYENVYRSKRRRGLPAWIQTTIIIVVSLLMAGGLLYYGLMHFEVGPFHPSVIQNR